LETPASAKAASYLDWSDRGAPTFVRYAIGLIVIFASWFVLGSLVAVPFTVFGLTTLKGSAAGQTLGLVSSFIVAAISVPLVTRYLLKRPWWSFGFPERRIDWRTLWIAVAVGLFVSLASTVIFGVLGLLQFRIQAPDPGQWLLLAAVAGVGLLLQTSTEEFMYRGYMTQFVRRYTSSPAVVMGVPSLIFAAMHIGNIAAFGGNWYALLPYLASALLYAWFAYRTGALWAAIGLHWANNLGNSVLVGTDMDVLPSLAPVIIEEPSFNMVLGVTIFGALLTLVLLEALIRTGEGEGKSSRAV
jgi:membrane protease YdiL (CAAX protease family)